LLGACEGFEALGLRTMTKHRNIGRRTRKTVRTPATRFAKIQKRLRKLKSAGVRKP